MANIEVIQYILKRS